MQVSAERSVDTLADGATPGFPELRGALAGLKLLDAADFDRYRDALDVGRPMGWSYYFPLLLTKNKPGRSALLWEDHDGSICLYRWLLRDSRPRLDLYAAPLPMSPSKLERCFERINEFNGDRSGRCSRIDTRDAEMLSGLPRVRIAKRKSHYLFAPANYTAIAGKKYHTVRRNVQYIEKLKDVEVRPIRSSDAESCHDLLRRWRTAHRAQHRRAGGFGSSKRAIDLVGVLPERSLRGEVVVIDGRLAAFSLGGELRPGLGCSFERKCDNAFRGLSYFQLRSLLLSLAEYELVNDGSDAGRPGLRQLKDSFRPVAMHVEYSAIQRR